MTGIILDSILMLLLVAALAYGVRLERKLAALRAGQLAFAGAVTELNTAASRAEAALASLRSSGQETDLLHDRIVKGRALKAELEGLMARAGKDLSLPRSGEGRLERSESQGGEVSKPSPALSNLTRAEPSARPSLPMKGRENTVVLQALAANQAAQQSLNRARRTLDEDLFAA